jgi:formylglycine-generating enzyme required for sulfatase activity
MALTRSLSGLFLVAGATTLLLLYARWREPSAPPEPLTRRPAATAHATPRPSAPDGESTADDAGAPVRPVIHEEITPGSQTTTVVSIEPLRSSRVLVDLRGQDEREHLVSRWRLDGLEPVPAWDGVLTALPDPKACPRYAGMGPIEPMADLIPLSLLPEERTGLYLFALDGTGEVPAIEDVTTFEPGAALVLALIPGGRGVQGGDPAADDQAEQDEGPVHPVELAPFYVALTETTHAHWLVLRGAEPHLAEGLGSYGQLPASNVTLEEVTAVLDGWGLSLPTEAQWEFAARAGSTTRFHTGPHMADVLPVAWVDETAGGSVHAVASAAGPNGFGLFDVHGNVWERCRDSWRTYDGSLAVDPVGEGALGIIRGGSWDDSVWASRSSARNTLDRADRFPNLGFRVVRAARP